MPRMSRMEGARKASDDEVIAAPISQILEQNVGVE
jgi:hypothetical protein